MINQTIQTSLELSKANVYSFSLITLWASFVIFLLLVGIIFKLLSNKKSWGDFFPIWFFSSLLTGIVLIFLLVSPSFLDSLLIKLQQFFS